VLHDKEKHVGTKLVSADYLIALQDVEPAEVANVARQTMMAKELVMEITRKKGTKKVNVRPSIEIARLADSSIWPKQIGILPDAPLLHLRLKLNMPAARPEELVKHLFGLEDKETPIVRLGFWREDKDVRTRSPLDSPPQDAPPTSPIAPNPTTDGVAPV
jgi:hypothetical protein